MNSSWLIYVKINTTPFHDLTEKNATKLSTNVNGINLVK